MRTQSMKESHLILKAISRTKKVNMTQITMVAMKMINQTLVVYIKQTTLIPINELTLKVIFSRGNFSLFYLYS